MKKNLYLITIMTAIFMMAFSAETICQLPGSINRPATSVGGRAILDPNGDGYTSLTTSGFGTNDVANSEIAYKGVRSYSIEPWSDLRRGPNHAYSDFVPDSSGIGFYTFFTAGQQLLFRFRMGGIMPGSKGFSVLMDTDGKFGATGPNADTNYLPSTNGTNGNPGFEIEVVLETNFRIAIYNVDGTSSPVMIKQYTNWQDMSQVSIAATNDNGDPDYLVDFYIPFSDLQAVPFNLTTSSNIRLTATTVMAPMAATGGPRSDIYGVATDSYEDFIIGQPGCTLFTNPQTCPTAMCTAAPTVNSPISTGTVNIGGTWTKSVLTGAAATASITVYKNGSSVGTVSNVSSGSTWSLPGITLVNGDVITAKASATGETVCLTSNSVTASTCNASNRPATPALTCTSGSKGLEGTNLSTGWTVHVDNTTRNVLDNNVTNASGLFGSTTGTSPNITWMYSGGCTSGAPLTSGSYKVYYTDNASGCNSLPAYFCAAGNGGSALAGSLAVPVITSPSNSVFTPAVNTISGTADANASLTLYINGAIAQTVTASGTGVFNFSNLKLLVGQQIYIAAELNTGTVSTSKCSNQTSLFTVVCYTQTPLISADNNNQLTALSPISGTSTEAAGTTIRVYTSGNTLVATTAVQANGTWSTGNAGTTPAIYNAVAATTYYAVAQNGSCGISTNSASFAAVGATLATRCGTITGPVASGATSISGTLTGSLASTTVNLYLDGQLIGSSVTSGTTWGPITVNSTANNTLYSNGVLSIGIQEPGKQEVSCVASAVTISCSPTPTGPAFTTSGSNINQNQAVTYTISNASSGTFYALADSATGSSAGQGKWATSNGSLNLTTNVFSNPGNYKLFVKSTSLSGVTQCSAVSLYSAIVVNPVILPVTLVRFQAKKQVSSVLLEWITANEDNLDHFELERSSNGSVFEKIGQVSAAGLSSAQNRYSFTDLHPERTINYYRLKLTDHDGKFSYSNTVIVSSNQSSGNITGMVIPNPFYTSFNIALGLDKIQPVNIQLADMNGKVFFTKNITGLQGDNTILCDGLSAYANGIYLLRVQTAGSIMQWKLVKGNK